MSRIRALATSLLIPAFAACASPAGGQAPASALGATSAPAVTDAESLVRAMQHRYAGSWYRTLSFKQTVKRTNPDGTHPPTEVWTEFAEFPGKLRIEFGEPAVGSGAIYAGDSVFVFRDGALTRSAAQRNPLLLLGFDVHVQPPEQTLRLLREEKFDLGRFHESTWQGRPVYVVGAEEGDLKSTQFWVDRERLLFVRLLQPSPQDPTKTSDIRFDAYRPIGGGWIAPEVVFLLDGREVMREDYFDMEVDVPLAPGLFDPVRWSAAGMRR